MRIKRRAFGVLLMASLLVAGIGAGAFLAGQPGKAAAAPAAPTATQCAEEDDAAEGAEATDVDGVEAEVECGPQDENEADEAADVSEAGQADAADETAPAGLAISAEQAQTIAAEANPGVATLAVEFDRENGRHIWEVEMDNGQDVKVDAGSGQILLTEPRD